MKAIEAANPGFGFEHWRTYNRLLSHTRTLTERARDSIGLPLAEILVRATYHLHNHAAYTDAEPLLQRALAILEKALGPGHPSTKRVSANLAALQRKA